MGPAGATILGNVLIANRGEEVSSVYVVPQPLFGEVVCVDERSVNAGFSSVWISDTAWCTDEVAFSS